MGDEEGLGQFSHNIYTLQLVKVKEACSLLGIEKLLSRAKHSKDGRMFQLIPANPRSMCYSSGF